MAQQNGEETLSEIEIKVRKTTSSARAILHLQY